jgi:hypothetical protein
MVSQHVRLQYLPEALARGVLKRDVRQEDPRVVDERVKSVGADFAGYLLRRFLNLRETQRNNMDKGVVFFPLFFVLCSLRALRVLAPRS